MDTKKCIRSKIKNSVKMLNKAYKIDSEQKIQCNILNLPEYKNAKTIFCFVSTEDEIDTLPIILDAFRAGKTVGVPKCISLGIMNVHEIRSMDDLINGKYNIKEPNSSCKIISPDEIDFGIIPCCTCNEKGERLGYGGGFYDRYLQDSKFYKAVIVREKLMYDNIPLDGHDIKMDMVINENKIIRLKEELHEE